MACCRRQQEVLVDAGECSGRIFAGTLVLSPSSTPVVSDDVGRIEEGESDVPGGASMLRSRCA